MSCREKSVLGSVDTNRDEERATTADNDVVMIEDTANTADSGDDSDSDSDVPLDPKDAWTPQSNNQNLDRNLFDVFT